MQTSSASINVKEIASLAQQGRFDDAERLLVAKGASIGEAAYQQCSGDIAFYRRDLQKAVHHYEAAIKLAPDHVIARYQYLIGTQDEKLVKFVDAFKRYQAAIEADRSFIDAYLDLGGLLAKVEDYEGAAKCYRDAAKLDESDPAPLFNLIAVLEKTTPTDSVAHRAELEGLRRSYARVETAGFSKSVSQHNW